MKIFIQTLVLLVAGSWLLSSCSDESPWGSSGANDGKIDLRIVADGSVTMGTRANESTTLADVPAVSQFSVALKSTDGSYSKEWNSVEAFEKEPGFPMGNYILSVYYGDAESVGFNMPYFYGESPVEVRLGSTSSITIDASLFNSMLSIKYSDELTTMFKSYHSSVACEGKDPVVYAYNETRAAYLKPGKAKVYLNLTNDAGESVDVNPVNLDLAGKHHYIVTFGVNSGDNGTPTLAVDITERIEVEEPLQIFLTDDLFNGSAPTVEASGFNPGEEEEIFDSFPVDNSNPELHAIALQGLKGATLTLTSDGKLPVIGDSSKSFELINADTETQSLLKDLNINCFGFFDNVGTMGVVNLKDFIKILPQGTYTVSLVVTDVKGKTSANNAEEKVVYKIRVTGLSYEITEVISPKFMDKEIIVKVKTNAEALRDKLTFYAYNDKGEFIEVKGTLQNDANPEAVDRIYTYSLATDAINDGEWKVGVAYENRTRYEKEVDVVMPKFDIETDAFAKRVKVRISNPQETDLNLSQIISSLYAKDNNTITDDKNLDKSDAENGMLIIKNLSPNTPYSNYQLVLGNRKPTIYEVGSFKTEEELDVPNGNFKSEGKNFKDDKLQCGGKWAISGSSSYVYTNYAKLNVFEPDKWETLNYLTCSDDCQNKNTWYYVPSTFIEGENCVIRTVGYSNTGEELDKFVSDVKSLIPIRPVYNYSHYYPSFLNKSKGKLVYDSKNDTDLDFNSRPIYVKFDYNYESKEGEKGIAIIKVFDNQDRIISSKEILLSSGEFKNGTYELSPYEFGCQASRIQISFESTTSEDPYIYIPSGTDLDEGIDYFTGRYESFVPEINVYKAVAIGSVLKISNVSLGY
ncbi:MAG: DUF4493 domain-containing protein [Muribaculaceae bacterium]|nr:DUF4493 domain-containing protein [Muribaculaceae bacterium]